MKRAVAWMAAGLLLVTQSQLVRADSHWAVSPSFSRSSDSDGLVIQKWTASALPRYTSGVQWQGIEWQQQHYRQGDTSLNGQGVNYAVQNTDALTGLGHTYKVGVHQGPHANILTADWSWNQALHPTLHYGVFASRDWVESKDALTRGIHYDLVGGNLDYQPHARLTLIGSLAQTRFSDHQDRQQWRARMVWDAWPEQGVTLQLSQRHQLGEKDGITRYYFNPERLDETMGLVGWRRKHEGWQWYARLGLGQQRVTQTDTSPTRLAELQVSSPVHGASFVKLRAGLSQTVGLNGPGYEYRYIDAQWIWALGR